MDARPSKHGFADRGDKLPLTTFQACLQQFCMAPKGADF
jgi:hypothetical protein